VYLSLPIFLAVILFIGGLGLLMSGCCSLSNGVPAIVREREAAQNRWLFFVTQCLGVLPAAQVSKSHHILLERLEVLLKDWTGKRRKLVKASTKTQLWPEFIEDVLCKVAFDNTVRCIHNCGRALCLLARHGVLLSQARVVESRVIQFENIEISSSIHDRDSPRLLLFTDPLALFRILPPYLLCSKTSSSSSADSPSCCWASFRPSTKSHF
jgi:hypothetical protein